MANEDDEELDDEEDPEDDEDLDDEDLDDEDLDDEDLDDEDLDDDELLTKACEEEDIVALDTLLNELIEDDELSEHLNEIVAELNDAARHGRVNVLNKLLELKEVVAEATSYSNTAYENAIGNRHAEVVSSLLKMDRIKEKAAESLHDLINATYNEGNDETLAEKKADNLESIQENLEVLQDNAVLLKNKNGLNPLHAAVLQERSDVVDLLLKDRESIFRKNIRDKDDYGRTALDLAFMQENDKLTKEILDVYEDILSDVCESGTADELESLLEEIFKHGAIDDRMLRTLVLELEDAIRSDKVEIASQLMKYDDVKNHAAESQNTAFTTSIKKNQSEIAKMLFSNAAIKAATVMQIKDMIYGNGSYVDVTDDDENEYENDYESESESENENENENENEYRHDDEEISEDLTGSGPHLLSIMKYVNNLEDDAANILFSQKKNLLHMAVESGRLDLLEALLKDEDGIFFKNVNNVDTYGRTALDIAIHKNNQSAIALIQKVPGVDLEAAKEKAKMWCDIGQSHNNEQLTNFLKLEGRDGGNVIDQMGVCNGWGFMNQVYLSSGREKEFYDILNAISQWDGKKESLQNKVPESLQNRYQNLGELFEQVSNDLVLFHYNDNVSNNLQLDGWGQNSRIAQYDLVKDPKEGRELRSLFNYSQKNASREQLIEILTHASRWRDVTFDVTGAQHATSLYITDDGKFKYFDSNRKVQTPEFTSAEALADFIIQTKYKDINLINSNGTLDINLNAYKFYSDKASAIPEVQPPMVELPYTLGDSSPNGFTELHYAIMENNVEKVQQMIEDDPDILLEVNAHGDTVIHMATSNNNPQMLNILLAAEVCDINQKNKFGDTPLHTALQFGYEKGLSTLLANKDIDLNVKNSYHQSPLAFAIERGNRSAIKELLNGGAKLDTFAKDALDERKPMRDFIQQLQAPDKSESLAAQPMLSLFQMKQSESKPAKEESSMSMDAPKTKSPSKP
jgi:ankyrin repeat protein